MGYKVTDAQIITALQKKHGLISKAAKALRVTPKTIRNRLAKSEAIQEALRECQEEMLDLCEDGMFALIRKRDPWAIGTYLKTIGRRRGYIERTEQAGVNFNVTPADLAKMTDAELDTFLARTGACLGTS